MLSAEPLGPDLYGYLVDTLHSVPAPERKGSHWVMNTEWMREIRAMADPAGSPLWHPAHASDGLDLLLGLPYKVREDGGVPHLERD